MLSFITGVIWEIIRLYFFLIGVVAFHQNPLEWLEFTLVVVNKACNLVQAYLISD